MCKAISKKSGKQCKLAPKKEYCHIHKEKPIQSQRISLIQSDQLVDKLQITIIERELAIQLTEDYLQEVKAQLKQAQTQIKLMKDDYKSYQVIKQYEREREQLLQKKVDLNRYDNYQFHELRKYRNYLVHEKVLTHS